MIPQTQVKRKLAVGTIGEVVDSSLAKHFVKDVYGATSPVKASGTVTFSAAATANDTVTINGVVFTAKATATTDTEFAIGASATESAANLKVKVNAKLAGIVTSDNAAGVLTITAADYGYQGNEIALAASAATVSGAYLSGGVSEEGNAIIGRAFTQDASDINKANMGGTGAFCGILTGPKQYANRNNLRDELGIKNGTAGQLTTFGRVWVRTLAAVDPSKAVFFRNTDGSFKGETGGYTGAGWTKVTGAKWQYVTANADEIACVELS